MKPNMRTLQIRRFGRDGSTKHVVNGGTVRIDVPLTGLGAWVRTDGDARREIVEVMAIPLAELW